MKQTFKIVIDLNPTALSSAGVTEFECRDVITEHAVALHDALDIRGMGSAQLRWCTRFLPAASAKNGWATLEPGECVGAEIEIVTEAFRIRENRVVEMVPVFDLLLRLTAERVAEGCGLVETPAILHLSAQ